MTINRRNFILSGIAASAGLVVGICIAEEQTPVLPYPNVSHTDLQPNAWLQVTPDNRIIFQFHKAEMGQGILTGLLTLVAEELNVPPDSIVWEFSGIHPAYFNPLFNIQITNASSSIKTCYQPISEAAASVRILLLGAASQRWSVPISELTAMDGVISHTASNRVANYGSFVDLAKTLPVPKEVPIKSRATHRYIGKIERRIEARNKTDGSAKYGIDIVPPDTVRAVVVRSPSFGGTLKKLETAKARQMRGVLDVFRIGDDVAVIATNTWYARRAAENLDVEWDPGAMRDVSSAVIFQKQREALDEAEASAALPIASGSLRGEYTAGFMAHAPMEPINSTVAINGDKVDVWVSTQAPSIVRGAVALTVGCPQEQVTVHGCYLGGGFGRRHVPDASVDAARIAMKIGRPVKVIWSREDDIQHDHYRPAVTCRMYGELENGKIKTWRFRIAGDSVLYYLMLALRPVILPPTMSAEEVERIARKEMINDDKNLETVTPPIYKFGTVQVDQVFVESGVPVFFWRSVGHSFNCFFLESFMDEMAQQAGENELEFRQKHLEHNSSASRLLALVAEKAGWGTLLPAGHSIGLAVDEIKGATVAMTAEVSVADHQIRVHRIVCAVDAGMLINPNIAKSVIESCIVFGLSACLYGEITIEGGRVKQNNFTDYPLTRMVDVPVMDVHLVESDRDPVGVGECAVAPVAAAIGNAVFKSTGRRLRSLPLKI